MTRSCIFLTALALAALTPVASADTFRITSAGVEDPVSGDVLTITLTYSTPAGEIGADGVPEVACWNGLALGKASEVPADSLTFDFSGARGLSIDDINAVVVLPEASSSVAPISLPLPPVVWSGLAMIGSLATLSRLRRR